MSQYNSPEEDEVYNTMNNSTLPDSTPRREGGVDAKAEKLNNGIEDNSKYKTASPNGKHHTDESDGK